MYDQFGLFHHELMRIASYLGRCPICGEPLLLGSPIVGQVSCPACAWNGIHRPIRNPRPPSKVFARVKNWLCQLRRYPNLGGPESKDVQGAET